MAMRMPKSAANAARNQSRPAVDDMSRPRYAPPAKNAAVTPTSPMVWPKSARVASCSATDRIAVSWLLMLLLRVSTSCACGRGASRMVVRVQIRDVPRCYPQLARPGAWVQHEELAHPVTSSVRDTVRFSGGT